MPFEPKTPISVDLFFDAATQRAVPKKILYDSKEYQIEKLGFHHYFRNGRTLYHIFSVTSGNMFFKLALNTDNLSWVVEEIYDAEFND